MKTFLTLRTVKSIFFLIATYSIFLFGCSGKSVDENNPASVYEDAESDISDKRYLMAIDKLKNVKNRFPYSHQATLAQLRIADVYFLEESFVEAAASYEGFRDLHPKHERADYVLFRIAESYHKQLPDNRDRDLTPGSKALEAYRELFRLYPTSTYTAEGRERLKEIGELLAEKEMYIANFYFKQNQYDNAARRFAVVNAKFGETSVDQEAYWKRVKCLEEMSKTDEVRTVMRSYIDKYPQGRYASAIGELLQKYGGN